MTGAWICLLFLSTNLPWQLDDYDQARQAFTSFQWSGKGIRSASYRRRNLSRKSRRLSDGFPLLFTR